MSAVSVNFLTGSSYTLIQLPAIWIHLSVLHHCWITFGKSWLHIVLLAKPNCPLAQRRSKAPEETDQQRPCLIRSYALRRLGCGLEVLSK